MSNTPETDSIVRNAAIADHPPTRLAATLTVKCEKLERERDDYMERCRTALSERDSWRMQAEQKYAMRRELEELLGVDRNDASDEQFQKGLDAIKNIIAERDEAREQYHQICSQTLFEINKAHQERDEARDIGERLSKQGLDIMDENRSLKSERDEARRSLEHITEYGTEEINAAVELRQKLAQALVERDEARREQSSIQCAFEDSQDKIEELERERDEARADLEFRRGLDGARTAFVVEARRDRDELKKELLKCNEYNDELYRKLKQK
jgi:hypothetical protein